MPLLSKELKARLPALNAQEAEDNPTVYARLFLPQTSLTWYVLGGEATGGSDFMLSCLFISREEYSFGHFPESFLKQFRGPNLETVIEDTLFQEGRLTDVVPAPDV